MADIVWEFLDFYKFSGNFLSFSYVLTLELVSVLGFIGCGRRSVFLYYSLPLCDTEHFTGECIVFSWKPIAQPDNDPYSTAYHT